MYYFDTDMRLHFRVWMLMLALFNFFAANSFAITKNIAHNLSQISVSLINPLSISISTNLKFGDLVKPNSGANVYSLTPQGNISVNNDDSNLQGNHITEAINGTIHGEPNQTFSCTALASDLTGPGDNIAVTTITDSICDGSSGKTLNGNSQNFQ